MADFKEEVRKTPEVSPVAGFTGRLASVVGDVLELLQLQLQLTKADAMIAMYRLVKPMLGLTFGAAAAIASLPIIAFGCADAIASNTGLKLWHSQLIVGTAIAFCAFLTIWISLRRIAASTRSFRRSSDELAKNVAWLQTVLRAESGEKVMGRKAS